MKDEWQSIANGGDLGGRATDIAELGGSLKRLMARTFNIAPPHIGDKLAEVTRLLSLGDRVICELAQAVVKEHDEMQYSEQREPEQCEEVTVTLWVFPMGLRDGHNPRHPKRTDCVLTDRLTQIVDRVIMQTSEGCYLVKDRDNPTHRVWEGCPPENEYRIYFDGNSLALVEPPPNDEVKAKLRAMRESLWLKTPGEA